jgi:hypothetical protein
MKKNVFYLALLSIAFASCNNTPPTNGNPTAATDSVPAPPPYTIQLEEVVVPGLPDLHSYTHAIFGDKIVMFGGRTSGLHSFNYTFLTTRTNTTIYVVNTHNWSNPTAWTVSSMPDNKIGFSRQQPVATNNEQFHANNAEFFTDSEKGVLYVIGGLLSVDNANQNPSTSPYITAIDLLDLVACVESNGVYKMRRNSIRQTQVVADSLMGITGGEVSVMDKSVYLVFGWNYFGSGDYYAHQVKKFTYSDNGFNLNIAPVAAWSDGFPNAVDSVNDGAFRRRDGSMSAMIDPADASNALVYYGGVFKQGYNYFTTPVWINKDTAVEQNFTMRSNIYTCQVIPVYSASRSTSYATLMGGIRNAYTSPATNNTPKLLTAANAPLLDTVGRSNNFSYAPFTNQLSTICIDSAHHFAQYLLVDSFPAIKTAITLPADSPYVSTVIPVGSNMYNGAEAEMHWNLNKKYLMNNGVVNYDALMADSTSGAAVGFLHGGILSSLPNVLVTDSYHFSVASNRLFIVRIVPLASGSKK